MRRGVYGAPNAANSSDAYLLDRSHHTGAQATSTITGLDAALALLAPGRLTFQTKSGVGASAYAFVLADATAYGLFTLASGGTAKTFNIPLVATVAWPIGSVLNVINTGAGQLTWTCAGGTITGYPGLLSPGLGAGMWATMPANDVWHVFGGVA